MAKETPTTLADYIRVRHGYAFKGEFFTEEETVNVLVTPGNFAIGGGFQEEKIKYYSGPVPEGYILKEGDLVVTMTDLSKSGDTLGYPALIPASAGRHYLHNQRIGLVEIRDQVSVDRRFLFYRLRASDYRQHILATASGSTVRHTSPGRITEFKTTLPQIDKQRAIAGVLGALDDKIEQNRRTARALERLACTIFRAWFVDFEPVKAKAEGATSFPSMTQSIFDRLPTRFIDSEIGPVPEGWEPKALGQLPIRVAMGPFGSDIKTDNFVSEGVPVIRGGNLTHGFVDDAFVYLTEAKADQLSNANAIPGDIVITHRGTLGQVGLIPAKSRYSRYVVSQSQMLVRPIPDTMPSHFLYLFLTSPIGQYELLANRSQTGVPAISRPTTSVKAIRMVVPEKSLLLHFESQVATLFDSHAAIAVESRKLAEFRDYLLPRLLNGSVRVEGANG